MTTGWVVTPIPARVVLTICTHERLHAARFKLHALSYVDWKPGFVRLGVELAIMKKGPKGPLVEYSFSYTNLRAACSVLREAFYPIATRLNSATVNPFDTLSRYCATVLELSFTKAWCTKVLSL